MLVGGKGAHEGNVYAYNPSSDIFGPVCDDFWTIEDVTNATFSYLFF